MLNLVNFMTTVKDRRRLPDSIRVRSRDWVYVRFLTLTDILSLHRMYSSLSNESKKFFRPTIFQEKGLRWLLANVALLISTIIPLNRLLIRLFPRIVILLAMIALNDKNEIVAFAYLNRKQYSAYGKYSAIFATCVRDDYQSRGLGSKLIKYTTGLAEMNKVGEIFVWVSSRNIKAIGLYKKCGFEVVQSVKSSQENRRDSDYLKMRLQLS